MRLKLPSAKFIRIFSFCAISTLSIGLSSPLKAQQYTDQRTSCDTITIGGPASWQPVSYIASDGRQTGLGIDILREYAERHGINVRVDIELPWARTLDLLLQGKIDVTAGAYFNDERQLLYRYSDPFFTDDIMVFQHVDRRFGYAEIDDLRGYRGARPHGGSLGNKIDTYSEQQLDIVYSPINDHIFDLLLAGHVDYVLLARYDGVATLQKLGAQNTIIAVEPPVDHNSVRLMFSRNSPCIEHVEQINLLINELTQNGTIKERTQYHLEQTLFNRETGS
ncbi:ABC transporter substrate-binding protein [Thalassospira sp. HJ]|uniref:substrate-binding periplasmic protein n=1 Tax=Thalassospira sp. HJ TaxID=1616823 RepID=UPI0005CDFE23|nr:transporter substrate-binding domain-containing protein [Thalassospira sp. HJ]